MAPPKVLIICDEFSEGNIWGMCIKEQIKRATVLTVVYGQQNSQLESSPSFVILAISQRRTNGVKAVNEIRRFTSAPLLVMSPIHNETYHLELYQAGADDCVTTPISPMVFVAKVNAWLRHTVPVIKSEINSRTPYLAAEKRMFIEGDHRIKLSLQEFRVLQFLMTYENKPFSSQEIGERVWGGEFNDPLLIKNIIYRIRKKIEPDPKNPKYLTTHPDLGYIFCGCFE